MDLGNVNQYYYNIGYRRGCDMAARIGPTFDSGYDRSSVFKAVLDFELLCRGEPIFWPIAAQIEQYGSMALNYFNAGVREGAAVVLGVQAVAKVQYSR